MAQSRRNLDFAQEAMGSERGGEFRVQDLDRHLAVVLQVFREKHGGHAAATDLRVDPVAIGKRRADLLKQFGHEYPAVCAEDTWITTLPEGKNIESATGRVEPDGGK